jgi:hypothetical protein
MEIIRDLLWLWILGALGGTAYIVWALFVRPPAAAQQAPSARPVQQITTRRTPTGPPPVAKPVQPGASAPSRAPSGVGAPGGSPEYQRRGSAPTVKLQAESGNTDDAAAADLFSGLSAAKVKADAAVVAPLPPPPPKTVPKDDVEKAGRIEQYGFHVGTKAVTEPPPPPPPPADARPATASDPAAGAPRTQTQELDDILKRIDAVLSESGSPASEATMPNQQQATMPLPQSPPTEKLERRSTDPNQQKLF